MSLLTLRAVPLQVDLRRLHNRLPEPRMSERLGSCEGCGMRVFVDDDYVLLDGSLFHAECGGAPGPTAPANQH